MAKTYLDELVEYPAKAIHKIGTTKPIVSLLMDDSNIDMDTDAAYAVFDKYLFDYEYVDGTVKEARAFVCIEVDLNKVPTATMQDLKIYVTIVCHKNYMKLSAKKFPGIIGNRRDNLVREIDKVLNGSDIFGIGLLTLDSVRTVASPTEFTAREIVYRISDFKNKGITRD